MASKLFKDLRETEYQFDASKNPHDRYARENYTVVYQGDPIFVVDLQSLTIKNYIVKCVNEHDGIKFMHIYCCEKGKYANWVQQLGNKIPIDWIEIYANKNSSVSTLASTTLKGAMKILDLFKTKSNFASLGVGDCIYGVNRNKNKVVEHKIAKIENTEIRGNYERFKRFIITLDNGGKAYFRTSYYESKASIYCDGYYQYCPNGKWSIGNYTLFVKKEDAQSYLDKKVKNEEKAKELPQIGTDTNINDAKGNRLHVGDTVAYVNGTGTYINLSTAKVIDFTPKMIKVLDAERRKWLIESSKESLKRYVERGNEPYEVDYTYYGVYVITTPKILLLKKYNKK
jgi:hypothetical protein